MTDDEAADSTPLRRGVEPVAFEPLLFDPGELIAENPISKVRDTRIARGCKNGRHAEGRSTLPGDDICRAFGASARDVQGRIIAQTLGRAAVGIALGTVASWLVVRSAARQPAVRRQTRRSRRVPAIVLVQALVAVIAVPWPPAMRRTSIRWWR